MSRLERLRFPVEGSRGRAYPELTHPYRNDYQRDRDRVIHTRAFRRLEDKTQVFPPGITDHFRNRLTHTLEVTQIARTVVSVLGLNEDLAEALALVHDIGHPPFAHAGEDELNQQMRRFGDSFDHNLHALRIVELFENRYARFPGLNLTFEVREGIIKHSRDYQPGEMEEAEPYLPGLRPPLEAQMIDLADEVAYNTADLDDGFAAGMFPLDQVREVVPEFNRIFEEVEGQFPGAPERVRFNEILRSLIDRLVSGLIEGTMQAADQAGVQTVDDVRQHNRRLAAFTPEAHAANRQLKQFLFHAVYFAPPLVEERKQSAAQIAQMFEYLMARPAAMGEEYREFTDGMPPHRAVCNYIAAMSDGHFVRMFRRALG